MLDIHIKFLEGFRNFTSLLIVFEYFGNTPLPLHAFEITYLPTVSLLIHARKGQSSLEIYFTLNLKDTNSDSRFVEILSRINYHTHSNYEFQILEN